MQISAQHPTMNGEYASLHAHNLMQAQGYTEQQFSFVRYDSTNLLLVVSNFSDKSISMQMQLPISKLDLFDVALLSNVLKDKLSAESSIVVNDLLGGQDTELKVTNTEDAGLNASFDLELEPLQSQVFELNIAELK